MVEASDLKEAIFAGGCFWCSDEAFSSVNGIHDVESGYTGGAKERPSYEEVSSGNTGHFEAVRVSYDPSVISYEELLDIYWKHIDPTDEDGQFADRGSQYRSAIFYSNDDQKLKAEASKRQIQDSGLFDKPIRTLIIPAEKFFRAEEYHQDYYRKCPVKFGIYKQWSGRKDFIQKYYKK